MRALVVASRRTVHCTFRAAVTPPIMDFLLHAAEAGTCVGTFVAYWRRRRDRDTDTFALVTRWSGAGLLWGLAYLVVRAVL